MNAISISPEELIAHTRKRCEDDFTFFVRYFFKHRKGVKFIFNDHHQQICDALMRVYRGETQGLIINVPPRYSKTELAVIMFSLWGFVKNKRCEFIHLSYADQLVQDNSDAIREIMKSSEFKQLWPHLKARDNRDAKGAWSIVDGGTFLAKPAGGAVTGFGAGRMDEWNAANDEFTFSGALIIDDPLKPDDARHDVMRKGVNKRWDETMKSRLNSPRTPVVCIMQRIHEEDFTAELLKDKSIQWEHIKMSAIVDEGKPTERALWPAKHTLETLKGMKAKNQSVFSAQYGQAPTPPGGGLLKGEWFKRYRNGVLPKIEYRKVYVDTAQKTKERNDYTVFEVWGFGIDKNIYLLDLIRGKWEAPEMRRKAVDIWNKHKAADVFNLGHLRQMRIEDKASGTGLIQDLKRDAKIPIFAQQRNIDKVIRVNDASPYLESGYVYIPEDAPWVEDFVSECEGFTSDDTHAHDDQVDPLCDAIQDMLGGRSVVSLWENMA